MTFDVIFHVCFFENQKDSKRHGYIKSFSFMISFSDKILDSVLDMTVAYPQDIIHSEADLGKGIAPQAVHFHAKTYSASDLPSDPDKLEAWCRNVWLQKEDSLKAFYGERKSFAVNGEKGAVSEEKEAAVKLLMQVVIGFWSVFLSVVAVSLFAFPLFKWYCIFSALSFLYIGRSYGGVDAILYSSVDH